MLIENIEFGESLFNFPKEEKEILYKKAILSILENDSFYEIVIFSSSISKINDVISKIKKIDVFKNIQNHFDLKNTIWPETKKNTFVIHEEL